MSRPVELFLGTGDCDVGTWVDADSGAVSVTPNSETDEVVLAVVVAVSIGIVTVMWNDGTQVGIES
jgi:hypothetical protein